MTSTMYNSNNNNTTVNLVSPRTDNISTRRTNPYYYNNQQKPLNNISSSGVNPYGYISLSHSPYDPAQSITDKIKSYDKYYNSLPPKYKSALKKNKYNEIDPQPNTLKTTTKNKKIHFDTENDVRFTFDKDFYLDNNLKNTVWWSAQELLFIRNIVMTEAVRIQRSNPKLKIGQCIKEVCKNT
jgi:hypothetical protein